MAQIQFGCCEAKEAIEIAKAANARSIDNRDSIENLFPLAFLALAFSIISFFACAYTVEKANERLLRLEKVVGMDEIERRK
jgi:hypothetical protein